MKKTAKRLKKNFCSETPRWAKIIRNTGAFVSGCSLAIMTALLAAQSEIPEWFNKIYPYTIGIPAMIAFISQFSSKKDE